MLLTPLLSLLPILPLFAAAPAPELHPYNHLFLPSSRNNASSSGSPLSAAQLSSRAQLQAAGQAFIHRAHLPRFESRMAARSKRNTLRMIRDLNGMSSVVRQVVKRGSQCTVQVTTSLTASSSTSTSAVSSRSISSSSGVSATASASDNTSASTSPPPLSASSFSSSNLTGTLVITSRIMLNPDKPSSVLSSSTSGSSNAISSPSSPLSSASASSSDASVRSASASPPTSSFPAENRSSSLASPRSSASASSATPTSSSSSFSPTPFTSISTSTFSSISSSTSTSSISSAAAAISSAVSRITDDPSGSDGPFSGWGTWFDTGLGACGWTNVAADPIVAVSAKLFDNWPGYNGWNPNDNPICGLHLNISWGGKWVVAEVADRCPGCAVRSLDFTVGLFEHFADLDVGLLGMDTYTGNISWSWAEGTGAAGAVARPLNLTYLG